MSERSAAVGLDDLAEVLPEAHPFEPPPDAALDRFWHWVDERRRRRRWQRPCTTCRPSGTVRDLPNVVLLHYATFRPTSTGRCAPSPTVSGSRCPRNAWPEFVGAATFDSMRARADDLVPNKNNAIWHDNQQFFRQGTSGQWRALLDDDDMIRYAARVAELSDPELSDWAHHGPIV